MFTWKIWCYNPRVVRKLMSEIVGLKPEACNQDVKPGTWRLNKSTVRHHLHHCLKEIHKRSLFLKASHKMQHLNFTEGSLELQMSLCDVVRWDKNVTFWSWPSWSHIGNCIQRKAPDTHHQIWWRIIAVNGPGALVESNLLARHRLPAHTRCTVRHNISFFYVQLGSVLCNWSV